MSKTIRESLQAASSFLLSHGVRSEECQQHAEWILLHVTGWNKTQLLMNWNEMIHHKIDARFQNELNRRANGEPVQYILGTQWFAGREFFVTPDVLIPRPETEILIERTLVKMSELPLQSNLTIADLGVGSGIISITMAIMCANATIYGVDLSNAALKVAAKNAEFHGVYERIHWMHGSFLEPILSKNISPEIILSNPPYIPFSDLKDLQREVRDYEPHLALDGGEDGLNPYRIILKQILELPKTPHLVAFEVGIGQAELVASWLKDANHWVTVEIVEDWQGIGRVVIATTNA